MVAEIKFCLPSGKWWFLSPYAEFPMQMEVDGKLYIFPTVDMSFKVNETVAFVGKSGAGKSTIFSLLCKLKRK